MALSTVKAAMSVRAGSNKLSSLINESLLSIDPAVVDYSAAEVSTLLENLKKELEKSHDPIQSLMAL
jgi:hypothetical protein